MTGAYFTVQGCGVQVKIKSTRFEIELFQFPCVVSPIANAEHVEFSNTAIRTDSVESRNRVPRKSNSKDSGEASLLGKQIF